MSHIKAYKVDQMFCDTRYIVWPHHHCCPQVTVAGLCRDSGYLFSCGVVTQVGSAVGALVMFILVNKVGTPASCQL